MMASPTQKLNATASPFVRAVMKGATDSRADGAPPSVGAR